MNKKIENEFGYVLVVDGVDIEFDDEGNETEKPYTRIDTVFINPEHRGQGHARRLLERALDGLTGRIAIVAEPQEDGVDACRLADFYESVGFSIEDDNILSMKI